MLKTMVIRGTQPPDRTVLHLDLDTFFVSVERLHDRRLLNRPVLVGGTGDRGVVAACSYEARAYGVHAAMPMRLARQLCPDAVVVRGDYERYMQYSDMVTEIISERVPLYEKSSIDEFYIDMTGMERFFGCRLLASDIKKQIARHTGLPASFGLSVNKTVSKVATGEAKPNGELEVQRGTEKLFLAPLTIDKIPMVGKKTQVLLRQLGIRKVRTLQQMPVNMLETVLGKNGRTLWKRANGIDETPVIPYSEAQSISTEETFQQDTIDVKALQAVLVAMTEKLTQRLRKAGKLTSCVTVKIRYTDFETHTRQQRIPYTCCDHAIIPVVKDLFNRLFNRRVLVRLVGVRFSHLINGGYQMDMFEDSGKMLHLYRAIDRINAKYGASGVQRAISMGIFKRHFNPFNGIDHR